MQLIWSALIYIKKQDLLNFSWPVTSGHKMTSSLLIGSGEFIFLNCCDAFSFAFLQLTDLQVIFMHAEFFLSESRSCKSLIYWTDREIYFTFPHESSATLIAEKWQNYGVPCFNKLLLLKNCSMICWEKNVFLFLHWKSLVNSLPFSKPNNKISRLF